MAGRPGFGADRVKPWDGGREFLRRRYESAAARNSLDPVEVWLDSLKWDGEERLDGMLTSLWGLDPADELVAWASRHLCLGPVWRTYRPGCKLDETVVLIGEQGTGKSALVKSLVPDERWYGDGIALNTSQKEHAEALAGRLIVEMPEMSGAQRADAKLLKSLMTRTDDGQHRAAYAARPVPTPRRCIMVGTSNRTGAGVLPQDSSGQRRYVCIDIPKELEESLVGPVEDWVDGHRDQLWAEAVFMYQKGLSARLPRHLSRKQAERNSPHEIVEQTFDDAVQQLRPVAGRMIDLAVTAGIAPKGAATLSREDENRLAESLRRFGWERGIKEIDGKTTRVWVPTGGTIPDDDERF